MKWTAKTMGAWLTENMSKKGVVEKAILTIDARQTESEKAYKQTVSANSVGWSSADASKGGYMADYIKSGRTLSGAWREKGEKLAFKYRAQLADAANLKAAVAV